MPIDQLANFAEVFGGIAVIVSLLYVALQVRANTQEQRHRRQLETFDVQNAVHDFLIGPANLSATYTKAVSDYNGMTAEDHMRFLNMYLKSFNAWDLMIGMYEDDSISKEKLDSFETLMLGSFLPPTVRHWWRNTGARNMTPSRVAAKIDAFIAQADAAGTQPAPVVPYDAGSDQ